MSFKDKELEKIYNFAFSKRYSDDIKFSILQRLYMMEVAKNINELRFPKSNHLEKLEGNLEELYSIRVNKQYRICFRVINNVSMIYRY